MKPAPVVSRRLDTPTSRCARRRLLGGRRSPPRTTRPAGSSQSTPPANRGHLPSRQRARGHPPAAADNSAGLTGARLPARCRGHLLSQRRGAPLPAPPRTTRPAESSQSPPRPPSSGSELASLRVSRCGETNSQPTPGTTLKSSPPDRLSHESREVRSTGSSVRTCGRIRWS